MTEEAAGKFIALLQEVTIQLADLKERLANAETVLVKISIDVGNLNKTLEAHKAQPHLSMDIQSLLVNLTNAFSLGFEKVATILGSAPPQQTQASELPDRGELATERQLEYLKILGVTPPEGLTKKQASKLIEQKHRGKR